MRLIAGLMDLAVVVLITWGLGLALNPSTHPSNEQDAMILLFLGISGAYSIGSVLKWGATPAKLLFGMRIVRMRDCGDVTWAQATSRWMSYALSFSVFGAGFLMAAFQPMKRTIHDLMAGTRVIRVSGRRGK